MLPGRTYLPLTIQRTRIGYSSQMVRVMGTIESEMRASISLQFQFLALVKVQHNASRGHPLSHMVTVVLSS
jgi:hypothetical protein